MSIDTLLNELVGDNPEQLEKPSTLAKFVGIKPDTLNDWVSRYPDHLPALKLPSSSQNDARLLVEFFRSADGIVQFNRFLANSMKLGMTLPLSVPGLDRGQAF